MIDIKPVLRVDVNESLFGMLKGVLDILDKIGLEKEKKQLVKDFVLLEGDTDKIICLLEKFVKIEIVRK